MLSTRYYFAIVVLVAVSAAVFLSCGESETDLAAARGASTLVAPGPSELRPRQEQHETGDDFLVASIDIEKATNGYDADTAPGPEIPVGETVTWTYVVTNTGDVPFFEVSVEDDILGPICTIGPLDPGESSSCDVQGVAGAGQYSNVGTATWVVQGIPQISDSDTSHYFGRDPIKALDIEKSTNGHDADAPPGPMIPVGDTVTWTYVVTNTGEVGLFTVQVEDDVLGLICVADYIAPGDSVTCTAMGTAAAGQYENVGTVTWSTQGVPEFGDADTSHYFGTDPAIRIEKSTNGYDADVPPGPTIPVGDPVTWLYVVTNEGNVPLTSIDVHDNQIGSICLRPGPLAPGDTMMCSAMGAAAAGYYGNVGSVMGTAPDGTVYMDQDPSHYYGEEPGGDDGCSHGYWKNHVEDWTPAGYSPDQPVQDVFSQASSYPGIGSATLMEALKFGGGRGVEGGARILLRQAVASLLNAAHPDVMFPRSAADVISDTNAALASGNRAMMTALAGDLDDDNNLYCPFDDDHEQGTN